MRSGRLRLHMQCKMTYSFHCSHQQTSLHTAWISVVQPLHYSSYCSGRAVKALQQLWGKGNQKNHPYSCYSFHIVRALQLKSY